LPIAVTPPSDLLSSSPVGLACERGGFHVDPWAPVPLAVVTHAHADHARPGSAAYLCAECGIALLHRRLGPEAAVRGVPYEERVPLGDTVVSFHPAGHIFGSAQVRVERRGEVWVVTGDHKRQPDPTCAAFEPMPCDVLITEATFALPIYCWPAPERVAQDIVEWWQANRDAKRASVLFCYPLGKAQRILAMLRGFTSETVFVHGALHGLTEIYRAAGIEMVPTIPVAETMRGRSFAGELVLAPELAIGSTWMRRFGDHETAFASGWMRVRGNRRRRSFDRGFELSDHADWPGLLRTIEESGARRVLATHGSSEPLARYLRDERSFDADVIPSRSNESDTEEV
jgi:putative mRNA 3-end processing factor